MERSDEGRSRAGQPAERKRRLRMKNFDLEPHEYSRDKPVQKEPILGPHWKKALIIFSGWVAMFTLIHLATRGF